MLHNNHGLTRRDFKKCVDGVRMDEVINALRNSTISVKEKTSATGKPSGVAVRLTIAGEKLNPEEKSLIRDVSPSPQSAGAMMSCEWGFSKRFVEENRHNLRSVVVERLCKEVTQTFNYRKEMSEATPSEIKQQAASSGVDKKVGWGRFLGAIKTQKGDQEHSYRMG